MYQATTTSYNLNIQGPIIIIPDVRPPFYGKNLLFSDFQNKSPRITRRSSFPSPQVKKNSELVQVTSSKVYKRLLFTCRTGNEKRRLIRKPLIQNLKMKTPVRNFLITKQFLYTRSHYYHFRSQTKGQHP